MVFAAWSPSEAALLNRYECPLSKVGAHPDMTLDVARAKTNQYTHRFIILILYI